MGQIDDIRARLEAFDVLIPNGLTDETLEDVDRVSWLAHRMCSKYTDDLKHLLSALDAAKAENERLLDKTRMQTSLMGEIMNTNAGLHEALVKARDSARRARGAHARRVEEENNALQLANGIREDYANERTKRDAAEDEVACQRHTIGRLVWLLNFVRDVSAPHADGTTPFQNRIDKFVNSLGLTWADAIQEGATNES